MCTRRLKGCYPPTRSSVDSLVDLLQRGRNLIQFLPGLPTRPCLMILKILDRYQLLLEHDLAKGHEDGKVVISYPSLYASQEYDIM